MSHLHMPHFPKFNMATAAILEFQNRNLATSAVTAVWFLISEANVGKRAVVESAIDTHLLPTFVR